MAFDSSSVAAPSDIATPAGSGGFLAKLGSEQRIPAIVARITAWIAALWGRPIRLGTKVIVARHAHVMEVLARDLDFRIAPINEARIDEVNGPFVLGMDRGVALAHERHALYQALAEVDLAPLREAVAAQASAQIAASDGEIDVVGGYARPIAARTAHSLFGITGSDEQTYMDVARAIFAHTFLNLSGDKVIEERALRAAELMRDWLIAEIAQRRAVGDLGTDMMGRLLRAGMLDDDGVRRTLGGMLVGSIDTTASAVAKIVSMIGRDSSLAQRIAADVNDEARLAGWCREVLRRWPHNPILLRRAVTSTRLADVDITAGDDVIAYTQAAMLDASVFPSPGQLHPDRPASAYLHFGGGVHPCAGRVINAFQIPLLIGALVKRGIKSVGAVQWAGPFPDHLILRFGR
jgi:cytochrome P450